MLSLVSEYSKSPQPKSVLKRDDDVIGSVLNPHSKCMNLLARYAGVAPLYTCLRELDSAALQILQGMFALQISVAESKKSKYSTKILVQKRSVDLWVSFRDSDRKCPVNCILQLIKDLISNSSITSRKAW